MKGIKNIASAVIYQKYCNLSANSVIFAYNIIEEALKCLGMPWNG